MSALSGKLSAIGVVITSVGVGYTHVVIFTKAGRKSSGERRDSPREILVTEPLLLVVAAVDAVGVVAIRFVAIDVVRKVLLRSSLASTGGNASRWGVSPVTVGVTITNPNVSRAANAEVVSRRGARDVRNLGSPVRNDARLMPGYKLPTWVTAMIPIMDATTSILMRCL